MQKLASLTNPKLLYRPACVSTEVREILQDFHFPQVTFKIAKDILVRQIRISNLRHQSAPATRFKIIEEVEQHFDIHQFVWPKKRGRADESLVRAHLFATCFRVWHIAFGEVPKTNNKKHPRSLFMLFVQRILRRANIGKLESHMESFRSYRKKALQNIVTN